MEWTDMANEKPTSAPDTDRSGSTEPLFTAADVRQLRALNAKLKEERDAALAAIPAEPAAPSRAQQAIGVSIQLGKYAFLAPVFALVGHVIEHKFPGTTHVIDTVLSWLHL